MRPLKSGSVFLMRRWHRRAREIELGAVAGGLYLPDNDHLLRGSIPGCPGPQEFPDKRAVARIRLGRKSSGTGFRDRTPPPSRRRPAANETSLRRVGGRPPRGRQAGRRPDLTPEEACGGFHPGIEPVWPDGAKIVWEWHVWDRDPGFRSDQGQPWRRRRGADRHGNHEPLVVDTEEITRLRALGYVPANASRDDVRSDMYHTNAINYNAALDQIVVSVRHLGEIWIIDHSTTTAEAAGRTGGRWGKGGDLLYRWGNPWIYRRGTKGDQKLGGQHDIRWIPEGRPGAGHLLVFNNEIKTPDGTHSAVWEFIPPTNADGSCIFP
jgi:hypothetical protein